MGKSHLHYLFYAGTVSGNKALLDREETRHARSVLRMKVGDEISVTNGKGSVFTCRIVSFAGKTTETEITGEKISPPREPAINVMIGLPEKNAFQTALKGIAALGVTSVFPVICRYSQIKWWENRWEKHLKRFNKTIIAASKQSLNPRFTEIKPPIKFDEVLENASSKSLFYADESGGFLDDLHEAIPRRDSAITCLIGPPGGFSPEEKSALIQADATPLQLAPYRLRTELASVIMIGCIIHKLRL